MARILGIENFTKQLEAYIQSGNLNFLIGSGASLPAIKLAGDIERDINELLESGKETEANVLALDFIQKLEVQNSQISIGSQDSDATKTLKYYIDFLAAVDRLLFERKNYLLPRQAGIFTTNYDMFFEHAASQLPSLILIDGFDRTTLLNGNFHFAPEQFLDRTYRSVSVYTRQSEVPTINLFKLHGSLNWSRLSDKITFMQTSPDHLDQDALADPNKVEGALKKRTLILPNLHKFSSTLLDRVYYDLLRFFTNSIEKENAILISFGFSFSDEHILDITRRALRNPTSQLIIFAYDAETVEKLLEKFMSQRNALIISPNDGENIDFQKFIELLNNVIPEKATDE